MFGSYFGGYFGGYFGDIAGSDQPAAETPFDLLVHALNVVLFSSRHVPTGNVATTYISVHASFAANEFRPSPVVSSSASAAQHAAFVGARFRPRVPGGAVTPRLRTH